VAEGKYTPASTTEEDILIKGKKVGKITKITTKNGRVFYSAEVGNSFISGADTRQQALRDLKKLISWKNEKGVAEVAGPRQVNQQNKKFILYLNNRAIAEFDTEQEARQQGQMVVSRVPNTQIEIKQEICTLSSIELKENLKKSVAEARKKKAQKKTKFKGFYFPGYLYYGMTGDALVGSDSGGMAEGEVIPFARKPQAALTWQQVPKDVLLLASDWYWADYEDGSLDAVLDPKGYGNGTANEVQYIAAKLQQKGWAIDHNDENDPRMGPFNLILTSKLGQSVLLPVRDAEDFTGWAAGTRPSMREDDGNMYRRPTAGEVSRTAQQTQAKLNPTASKFVWKKPNQIGGSYSEQDLMAKGFKKSQYNSWGGTQAMWDRLTRVSEQLNQPTPTAQQILDKHNLSVEEFIAQLKLGVKVEFEHTKDAKTAYEIALDHLNERPDYYTVLAKTGLEEDAAGVGVVAKNKKMAKDPRYSTSMTVDVQPSTPAKNMRALRLIK
jgi:hypothetical protein